jgi:TonB-linked SusC/RagA family outer membrane protein
MGLLFSLSLFAQNRQITGRVADNAGNPMANVSVQVKGATGGTTTDAAGRFSITVPASATALLFSFSDMGTQEISIVNQAVLSVTMQANNRALDEVVVVGYGTQRRREITGNIAQVSGSKLRDQPIQTFEQGLSGRAAGVNINIPNGVVGNPPVIRVRGVNSISLSSFPLVVIDGVPSFSGDNGSGSGNTVNNILSDINPADIESIEILKDASAAAIYGSRASAGVLLITTKRGRQGRTRVNYDTWAGWTNPYRVIEVLNAQEYTDLKNEGLVNAGTPPNGTTRGFATMNDANGKLIDTRWYDYVYRTGFSHNHNLSVSGANEKTSYYLSTGYTKQEGFIRNNSLERMSGRFNLDHSLTSAIKLGASFGFTNNNNEAGNTGSTGAAFSTGGLARTAFVLAPNVGPYNADGSYNINVAANSIGQGANLTPLNFYNPVPIFDLNRYTSKTDRILANVYGQLRVIQGLNFKTLNGIDNISTLNDEFRSPVHGDGIQYNGAALNQSIKIRRWSWQNTLTYDTKLTENHGINILVGAEQQYTNTNAFGADRRNISDPFFTVFQGGFSDIVPSGNGFTENFLQSYFGRVNYDFKRRYFLSGNIRRDGYSAFANKWGTFGGGSVGWTLSEENFYKNSKLANAIGTFRLRGSYGVVGNFNGVSSYAYRSLYRSGLNAADATLYFNQAGNPNLTWEKSKKLDVGFTAGLLKDRFTVEFAYYKNEIYDLILDAPQAPSRGIPNDPSDNVIPENVGSMTNRGIEITLNGTILSGKNFSWTSNLNFTTVKNTVNELANNNADIIVRTGNLENTSIIRVGQSVGSFYVVPTEGVNPANGQRIFRLGDGTRIQYNHAAPIASRWTKVSDGSVSRAAGQALDGIVIGPAIPKYFGGFDNTFRYKGFDLNVLVYFSGGNYVYNGSRAGLHDNRNWNNAKDALQRWQKAGDVAKYPRVVFGDNVSNGSAAGILISENVEKGNFAKIRNIALGYALPKSIADKLHINGARLYVAVLNAYTFTSYSGFDPEVQTNNGSAIISEQVANAAPSVDRNTAPLARTINVGLNINF